MLDESLTREQDAVLKNQVLLSYFWINKQARDLVTATNLTKPTSVERPLASKIQGKKKIFAPIKKWAKEKRTYRSDSSFDSFAFSPEFQSNMSSPTQLDYDQRMSNSC